MSKAIDDVVAERRRLIEVEGRTGEQDDQHGERQLARVALCYVKHYVGRSWLLEDFDDGAERYQVDEIPDAWPTPWPEELWKPENPRRDLVRAAALLIAEVERLDGKH